MAQRQIAPLPTPSRAPARSARMGWIRPPGERPVRGPWPGDVTAGTWFEHAHLPRWLNGGALATAIRLLVISQAVTGLLGLCYLLMSLGH